eukprot:scaffold2823_cov118-Isochrysis_galbana.AAC.1
MVLLSCMRLSSGSGRHVRRAQVAAACLQPAAGRTQAAAFRNAERAASVARGAAPRQEAGTDRRPLGHVPHMTCRARRMRMRMPHTLHITFDARAATSRRSSRVK